LLHKIRREKTLREVVDETASCCFSTTQYFLAQNTTQDAVAAEIIVCCPLFDGVG
jgi:hypothetical protein